MGITIIIMSGLVLMTMFASGFDFFSKRRNKMDNEIKIKVEQIEHKLEELENTVTDKNDRIEKLENDLSFMNKLLEKK